MGRSLAPGDVVTFEGELGAGKTTFIQAITRGLGVAGAASSPTYALVHRYHGRRGPVFHLDCYRLRSADEAADLDWEGLLARATRSGRVAGAGRGMAAPPAGGSGCITWPNPSGAGWSRSDRLALETATDRASVALGRPRATRWRRAWRARGATRRPCCRW